MCLPYSVWCKFKLLWLLELSIALWRSPDCKFGEDHERWQHPSFSSQVRQPLDHLEVFSPILRPSLLISLHPDHRQEWLVAREESRNLSGKSVKWVQNEWGKWSEERRSHTEPGCARRGTVGMMCSPHITPSPTIPWSWCANHPRGYTHNIPPLTTRSSL